LAACFLLSVHTRFALSIGRCVVIPILYAKRYALVSSVQYGELGTICPEIGIGMILFPVSNFNPDIN